jgi:hypothetical protein
MWQWIMRITLLVVSSNAFTQVPQLDQKAHTRFGDLTVGDDKVLLFRGHRLQPSIKGNSSLDVGRPFQIGATDIALVTDNGGTACPYLYYFVTLSESAAKTTPSFGTCNVAVSLKQNGETISVSMHGYRGPFEPEADRRMAARETHVFVFRDGAVTENRKAAR